MPVPHRPRSQTRSIRGVVDTCSFARVSELLRSRNSVEQLYPCNFWGFTVHMSDPRLARQPRSIIVWHGRILPPVRRCAVVVSSRFGKPLRLGGPISSCCKPSFICGDLVRNLPRSSLHNSQQVVRPTLQLQLPKHSRSPELAQIHPETFSVCSSRELSLSHQCAR